MNTKNDVLDQDLIMAGINFIEHAGVKGMKWGVRKDRTTGVSRSTDREARKDAQESARAKLFYGDGAGNRRKLIKATVEAKKKRDPDYAKAFDHHFSTQDLSKHASGARKERSRTDRKENTKKRAGYLARRFTGEMGTQAAFTAVVLGGAVYLNSPKGRSHMNMALSSLNNAKNNRSAQKGAAYVSDYFKRNA